MELCLHEVSTLNQGNFFHDDRIATAKNCGENDNR